jgi:hypothetical protein
MNSLLSGKIGQPAGAFTHLSNKQAESAIEFLVEHQVELTTIVQEGTGASATPGARVAANGTLLASTGVLSSARTGLGQYTVTIDGTAQTVGGFIQMWPVATPSGVSGDGGDGVSPFKEASGFEAALTDTIDQILFFYSPLHNKVYALGADSDDIWIHDIADWDATAVQKDSTIDMALAGVRSGCMDYDGDIVWVSGTNPNDNVMAYTISTDTWTQFDIPSVADAYRSIIGSRDGYVVVETNSTTRSYQPNFSTGLMGPAIEDWATVFHNSVSNVLTWDAAGYGWTWFGAAPGELYVVKPDVATIETHALPFEIDSTGTSVRLEQVNGPVAYDSRRNAILVSLTNGSSLVPGGIFRYSDWTAGEDDSGVWERLTVDTGWTSLAYDADTDIIIGVGYATDTVERFTAQTGEKIDSVDVSEFAATYSVHQGRHSFYLNGSHYLLAHKGGTEYILRIDYAGDDVTLVGSGDSFVSSVLVAQTSVINATTAGIQIYRSLDPPVRADAQFSCHIGFK